MECESCKKKIGAVYEGKCQKCLKMSGLRGCKVCGIKPISEFYQSKGILSGCKVCISKKNFTGKPVGAQWAISKERHDEIEEMYRSGLSSFKIAEIFKVSRSCVGRILKKGGVDKRKSITSVGNPRIFEFIDTPEKAYWLGFMATDGNVYGSRIQFNLQRRDEGHLEKFKKFVGGTTAIKHRQRKPMGTRKEPYLLSTYSFRCKEMCDDLAKHGLLPKKSFTVKPWDGPDELLSHYWRGCVDGDGWSTPKTLGLCGNLDMVNGFKAWAQKHVAFNTNVLPHSNIFTLHLSGKTRDKLRDILYSNAPVFLDRKGYWGTPPETPTTVDTPGV